MLVYIIVTERIPMRIFLTGKRLDLDHKATILVMRWLVVLLVIFMAVYSAGGFDYLSPNYVLAMVIVALNAVISLFPPRLFERPWFTYLLLVADIGFVSAMIYFAEGINTDFYLVYFMSIFMSSIGRSVGGALPVAVVASVLYGWLAFRQGGTEMFAQPAFWLRVPFFFLVALFSSLWAGQVDSERRKKEEAERFNQRLEGEIELATEEIRRRAESNRVLKEYNENILASISSGVVVVDVDGAVTTLNREASKIFRLTASASVGKALAELDPLKPLGELLRITMESGRPQYRREMRAPLDEGREAVLSVSTSILHNQTARSNGAIAVINDLTNTRALEERVHQSEKLAVLGEMAAVMAHEIRNPLNSIAGFAQLLQARQIVDPKIQKHIKIIVQEAFRIDTIISDILDFAHQRKAKTVEVRLEPILEKVVCLKREVKKGKEVEVGLVIEAPLPAVRGDPGRLERVLANLLNNAWEAVERRGKVEVSARPADNGQGPGVLISVADDGCGISPENAEMIFKPFFTTKSSGTGLGLAIIQKIVEEHQGTIGVESSPGRGARFEVFLPAKAA